MAVEQQRPSGSPRHPGRRGQQARPVHVEEIGPGFFGQSCDLTNELGSLAGESQRVARRFVAGCQMRHRQRVHGDAKRMQFFDQAATAWNRAAYGPSRGLNGRHKIQQAQLRAAQIAELIEEQDVHCAGALLDSRTAQASTRKYTGSTRQ